MVRIHAKVRAEQKTFLEFLPGTLSEHLRQAIDDYIIKKNKEYPKASISPSKIKKGG